MTEAPQRPFDTLEAVFGLSCRGPRPLSIEGQLVDGLPERDIALDELRAILLHPSTSHATRDAALSLLLTRARQEGGGATVGLAGVLLFGLRRSVAVFCELLPEKVPDVEAEALAGFVEGIARTEPSRRRLAARLTWLGRNRAKAFAEAELAEVFLTGERPGQRPPPAGPLSADPGDVVRPEGQPFSASPPFPYGHPDLVLAKAVDEAVIHRDDAALIGDTRLGPLRLTDAARALGIDHWTARKRRQRAEEALWRWITSPDYEKGFVQKRPETPYLPGGGRPRHGAAPDRRPEVCPKPRSQGGDTCPTRSA